MSKIGKSEGKGDSGGWSEKKEKKSHRKEICDKYIAKGEKRNGESKGVRKECLNAIQFDIYLNPGNTVAGESLVRTH